MTRRRRTFGYWLPAWFAFAGISAAQASVNVFVEPQTTTVGQPVAVFGDSDCEVLTVDFGDGTPAESFDGPGSYSTTHVYTAPSPDPPGVWLVTARGTTCATAVDSAAISVIVNAGAGGPPPLPPPATPLGTLFIERLGLRFENSRPEIRVLHNQKGVQAFADIQYTGTGLLQGYWEVDGVIWSFVNRHLVFGKTVTIASPPVPGLPTVDPGVHRVRFVLTRPAAGFTPPLALYFAGYDEALTLTLLRLVRPVREARIPYEGQPFEWASSEDVGSYRVSYFDAESRQLVFSALTRSARYELLDRVLEDRFVPGRRYEWQVAAYDGDGEELVQSLRRPFMFEVPAGRLARQVIIATEWSMAGAGVGNRLAATYQLRELRAHRLESLNLQITLLETSGDVRSLARQLQAEDGVVLAEPNFVLRTLGGAPRERPILGNVLDLEVLHERARGRRVRVALIDTGIDTRHVDLKDRVVVERNFVDGAPHASEIHGTAVAGVVAGRRNGAGITGVAPEAQLLALRACRQPEADSAKAICESFDVARALDAALIEGAEIVNMSFGGAEEVPLIARLIELGSEAGVRFVAPVGNARWQRQAAFPARHEAVIAVAGHDEAGRAYPNEVLYGEGRVAAPATNVFTSIPGGRYNFVSGTSFSSAAVAGLLALALEQRPLNTAELPPRDADLCAWTEQLMQMSLCTELSAEVFPRSGPVPATQSRVSHAAHRPSANPSPLTPER